MPNPQRSSDVIEVHAEKALLYGISGLVATAFGALCVYYRGMLLYAGWIFLLGGIAAIVFAVLCATQVRKVHTVVVSCPFCKANNRLTEHPEIDFMCTDCYRLVPVLDGKILPVQQVKCGFCGKLNFYSEKSHGLICEECDREIPIAGDGNVTKSFSTFARHDDDKMYDLVLTGQGHKTEELITCLQHMLALNRNQVKDILGGLPATLLTGIPRRKAEMLLAQLTMHDGQGTFSETPKV